MTSTHKPAESNGHQLSDAMRRFGAIATVLDVAATNTRLRLHPPRRKKQKRSVSAIVRECAAANGVSEKTLWRWLRSFRQKGYSGLQRSRSDNGVSRFFNKHPEAAGLVLQLYDKNPRVRAAAVYRHLHSILGQGAPSYATVRHFLYGLRLAKRNMETDDRLD
jgi:hypothetical protein